MIANHTHEFERLLTTPRRAQMLGGEYHGRIYRIPSNKPAPEFAETAYGKYRHVRTEFKNDETLYVYKIVRRFQWPSNA